MFVPWTIVVWKIVFKKFTVRSCALFPISTVTFFWVQIHVWFSSLNFGKLFYTLAHHFFGDFPNWVMIGKLNFKLSLKIHSADLLLVFMHFRRPLRCWKSPFTHILPNIAITVVWFSDSPNCSILEILRDLQQQEHMFKNRHLALLNLG